MTTTLACGCLVEIDGGHSKVQPRQKRAHETTCAKYRELRDGYRAAEQPYRGTNAKWRERDRALSALKDRDHATCEDAALEAEQRGASR